MQDQATYDDLQNLHHAHAALVRQVAELRQAMAVMQQQQDDALRLLDRHLNVVIGQLLQMRERLRQWPRDLEPGRGDGAGRPQKGGGQ